MSNLSPAMKIELSRSNPNLRIGMVFQFPDGTRRYSDVGWSSLSQGFFAPQVKSFGRIKSSAGDRRNALEVASWAEWQLLDRRDEFKTRDAGNELRGTPHSLVYGSKRVPVADWLNPRFAGVMLDWRIQNGVVTGLTGPAWLMPLRAPVPDIRFLLADFPELPDESVDMWAQIGPYGRHDSFAFGNLTKGDNDGQITPLYVGEYTEKNLKGNEITGSKYILGPGQVKGNYRVFFDHVKAKDNTWNGQAIYEEINGRMWSRVMFNANKSSKIVTLDCDGYESEGDGSGYVITDPVEQLIHFLSNFVFGKYKTGLWLPTATAQIDALFGDAASLYLGQARIPMGYKGARYIEATENRKPAINHVNDWTETMQMRGLTTVAGKLGVGADNFDPHAYIDDPWIRRPYHVLRSGPLTPARMSLDAAKRVSGEAAYSHALQQFTERLSIISAKAVEEGADTISCPWGTAHL